VQRAVPGPSRVPPTLTVPGVQRPLVAAPRCARRTPCWTYGTSWSTSMK
jgi:hypothetical protein